MPGVAGELLWPKLSRDISPICAKSWDPWGQYTLRNDRYLWDAWWDWFSWKAGTWAMYHLRLVKTALHDTQLPASSFLCFPPCVHLEILTNDLQKQKPNNQPKKPKQTKKSPCFLIAQISMERPGRKQGNRDLFHTSSSGEWLSVEKSRDWTQRWTLNKHFLLCMGFCLFVCLCFYFFFSSHRLKQLWCMTLFTW